MAQRDLGPDEAGVMAVCPTCGLVRFEHVHRSCPRCDGPGVQAAPTPAQAEPPRAKAATPTTAPYWGAGVIVFVVVMLMVWGERPRKVTQPDPPAKVPYPGGVLPGQQSSSVMSASALDVGDEGVLDDGDTLCTLAIDEAAWNAMLDVQNGRGQMMPLIRVGLVIPAPRGSTVTILGGSVGRFRVQLRDGGYAGRVGWIQREFVHPMTSR